MICFLADSIFSLEKELFTLLLLSFVVKLLETVKDLPTLLSATLMYKIFTEKVLF